jgi:hypothetical protein
MSAPSPEHSHPSAETLDQLSQSDLLERRAHIDEQLDRVDAELKDYVDKLKEAHDPELTILERIEDDEQSDPDLRGTRPVYSYMIERGEGLLSAELITLFQKMDTLDQTEEKVLDQLDTRFAPGLIRYARDEALEIISNLDYVTIGQIEKNKSLVLPDSDGIPLRELEDSLPRPDAVVKKLHDIAYDGHANSNYRYAELLVDEIERCKAILKRWGVGTIQPLPKPVYDHVELERAEELNNRYRNYHNEVSALSAELRPLLPMHEWAVNLPDGERDKFYDHLASIDLEKELARLKFEGLELLPFEFTDAELRDYIHDKIPAIALEGLNTIVFRASSTEETERDRASNTFGGKGETLAHHAHDLSENRAEIVIFTDKFQKLYDKYMRVDPDEIFVEWIVKNELLDTLAHEFGHALHHTLPVSILHEWDEVAGSEDVEVTSYVSEMNKLDHRFRYMEDFADSFSIYANKPRDLLVLAEKRFEKMREIITRLTPRS